MGAPNQPIEPIDAGESGFRYLRRVQFHETDQAGVAHFSWFFRYMEEAEHALWRAAGLSIDRAGCDTGWPRVSATFDFKSPLYFEDEFDQAHDSVFFRHHARADGHWRGLDDGGVRLAVARASDARG